MGAPEIASPASVWTVGAELGEGPVWVERDQALWFVDIKRQNIHRFDPANGDMRSWDTPEQIGFLLPGVCGGFVAGMQSGLHSFDEGTGRFARIVDIEAELPGNRINDGTVDPCGRLWFGTMADDERTRSGSYYVYHRDALTKTTLPQVSITNGPAISPDGRILYHVDTLAGTIQACDVGDDGRLGPSRPFARIDPADGFPDGPAVDAEGCVWIGLYFGWEARRYSPSGELLGRVRFPTSNITKVAFGGPDLRTLYATSAQQGLKLDALGEQPEAGSLFAATLDVPGLPGSLVSI